MLTLLGSTCTGFTEIRTATSQQWAQIHSKHLRNGGNITILFQHFQNPPRALRPAPVQQMSQG